MKLLVVEDEKLIADSLKKGLEQENFVVDVAYNGNEGYDLAANEHYDVILLDLMLPFMDGITITKKLREEDIKTPILMLTAKGEVEDKVSGLNTGADDYLAKPFDFSEVVARVRALGRRPRKLKDETLRVDDLEINTTEVSVRRAGKEVDLSKKEYSLLEYLVRNRGTVLSKEKIMQDVWSFDADILPNTVEVYIGYLRSKIDKPFGQAKNLIKTVRGFGYKIDSDE